MAFRNIRRNKRSSFLLLILIALITFVFFLGNSLIDQSVQGMRRTYVENLTGDLVVQKQSRVSMNLFGANTPIIDEYFKIPTLPAYDEINKLLSEDRDVRYSAGIVSGQAVLDVLDVRAPVPLMGVDAESYFDLFSGIILEKGEKLLPGQQGIMLTTDRVESIEKQSGQSLEIGTPILLTSAGNTSFKIREVLLTGIYSYSNPGPYMEEIVITDPQTVRALSSVLAVATEAVNVSDDALELLDQDMDDLFGDDDSFSEIDIEEDNDDFITSLQDELQNTDRADTGTLLGGDWNFLILRLRDNASSLWVQSRLNSLLEGFGAKVVGWQTAAGNSALLVLLIQAIFYGGMILVGFACIITIVNIILISVFKRTKEMGTLRAIGVSDGYIMVLLLLENLTLASLGGLTGIGLGFSIVNYINSLQWPIPHALISALMGSTVLFVAYSAKIAVQSLLLSIGIGLIASLFPGWKATRINPIEAVRRG